MADQPCLAHVSQGVCIVSPYGISIFDDPAKHPLWIKSSRVDGVVMIGLNKRDRTLMKFLSGKYAHDLAAADAIQCVKDLALDASASTLGHDGSIKSVSEWKRRVLLPNLKDLQEQSTAESCIITLPQIICCGKVIGPYEVRCALDLDTLSVVKVEASAGMATWLCAKAQEPPVEPERRRKRPATPQAYKQQPPKRARPVDSQPYEETQDTSVTLVDGDDDDDDAGAPEEVGDSVADEVADIKGDDGVADDGDSVADDGVLDSAGTGDTLSDESLSLQYMESQLM